MLSARDVERLLRQPSALDRSVSLVRDNERTVTTTAHPEHAAERIDRALESLQATIRTQRDAITSLTATIVQLKELADVQRKVIAHLQTHKGTD